MAAHIRPARPGDGRRLADLHIEMGAYYVDLSPEHFHHPDPMRLVESLERDIAAPDHHTIFLVAEQNGDVVAAAAAHLVEPTPTATQDIDADALVIQLHVDYLVTTASERRSGLATQLIRAVEDWGRSNGAALAAASTFVGSPVSIPFWHERMGYETRSVNLRKRL